MVRLRETITRADAADLLIRAGTDAGGAESALDFIEAQTGALLRVYVEIVAARIEDRRAKEQQRIRLRLAKRLHAAAVAAGADLTRPIADVLRDLGYTSPDHV